MEKEDFKVRPEFLLLVDALHHLLQAEEQSFSAYACLYGDTIPEQGGETGGEREFTRSGLPSLFEDLKKRVRESIGLVTELDLQGLLSSEITSIE